MSTQKNSTLELLKLFASYMVVFIHVSFHGKVGIAIGLLLVIITLVTDFISLGTLTVSLAAPVGFLLITGRVIIPLILMVASAMLILKHIENIHRLLNKTEIGLRSTIKGENRVK